MKLLDLTPEPLGDPLKLLRHPGTPSKPPKTSLKTLKTLGNPLKLNGYLLKPLGNTLKPLRNPLNNFGRMNEDAHTGHIHKLKTLNT